MFLAYVDDSGDQDSTCLGVVVVPAEQWLDVHDELVRFRSGLSTSVGFRMRSELKATQLVAPAGRWRTLGTPMRKRIGIYRASIRHLATLAPVVRVFGVVVPDNDHPNLKASPTEEAWEVVLQRLERLCFYEESHCFLIPDVGNSRLVRSLARRKRRFGYAPSAFGGASRKVPFKQLVDDPAHRDSQHSYLMQWADLVAYAAFRRIVQRSDFPPNMWESLGPALHSKANDLERSKGSKEPEALIVWPERMRKSAAS